ncbi:MAG: hypothetical protein RLZZ403_106 [Pseudomonadota bacterium]
MTKGGDADARRQGAARQGRAVLYLVGGVLAGGAVLLDLLPSLAPFASPLRVRICALAGAFFLALGRFGSPRFLARLGTGWGRPR